MKKLGLHKKSGRFGFDGRQFLLEEEWKTFLRNLPVRYIHKKKDSSCFICGKKEDPGNKFENSHRIGFKVGIVELGLTPDYLNSDKNIVTAHKRGCNKLAEIDLLGSMQHLHVTGVLSLPGYLPKRIHELWAEALNKRTPSDKAA